MTKTFGGPSVGALLYALGRSSQIESTRQTSELSVTTQAHFTGEETDEMVN